MIRYILAALLFATPAWAQTGNLSGGSVKATDSTTARTLAARTADVINAADWGVVANTGTDQTTALQAAIAEATADLSYGTRARQIILPAGEIVISPITLTKPVTLQGAGSTSTVLLLATGATSPALTVGTTGTGPVAGGPVATITLRDLRISSQSIKSGSASAHGLSLVAGAYISYVVLENVTIYGMPGNGITSVSFNGAVLANNVDIYNNLLLGVSSNSDADWHFYGGGIAVNGDTGVLLSGSTQFSFVGTNIFSNQINLYLYSAGGSGSGNHTFTNVMFDRARTTGVVYDMRGTSGAIFTGSTFSLASTTTPNTYNDVLIASGANSLATFDGSFWGNNYTNDVSYSEAQALSFAGASNTVTLTGTNHFAGGTLRTNLSSSVVMGRPAVPTLDTGVLSLTIKTATQYRGVAVNNGTNGIAALQGDGAGNDNGALFLLNAGSALVKLVANGSSYIAGPLYLGNGVTNAAPTNNSLAGTGGSGTDIAGGDLFVSGGRGTGTGVGGDVIIHTAPAGSSGTSLNALVARVTADGPGNVVIGPAAVATNATDGFLYVPSGAGTPTGAPTSYTGRVPIYVDSTNHKLYFYSGGAWRDAGP